MLKKCQWCGGNEEECLSNNGGCLDRIIHYLGKDTIAATWLDEWKKAEINKIAIELKKDKERESIADKQLRSDMMDIAYEAECRGRRSERYND